MRLTDRLRSWQHFWAAIVAGLLILGFVGGSLACALWIALSLKERSSDWSAVVFIIAVIVGAVIGVFAVYLAALAAAYVAAWMDDVFRRRRERVKRQ